MQSFRMRAILRLVLFTACFTGFLPSVALGGHGGEELVDAITPERVKLLLDSREKLHLFDIRPLKDFNERRIPGARSIPMMELDKRFGEVPRSGRAILYCSCQPGGGEEAYTYQLLRDKGYRNVSVMEEGFSGWVKRKYPVETGSR